MRNISGFHYNEKVPFQFNLYALVILLAAAFSTLIGLSLWKNRKDDQALFLMIGILLGAEWSWMQGFESLSTHLPTKVFLAQLSYIGIYGAIPFFLLFTLKYVGLDRWTTISRAVFIFILPVVIILLCWTNQYHFLIWSGFVYNPEDPRNVITYLRGPLYWLGVAYIYSLVIIISLLLFSHIRTVKGLLRQQSITIALGVAPVFIASLMYLATREVFGGYDFTPIGFAMMGGIFYLGARYLGLFSIYPIPRSAILESFENGVIVIDAQDRIVDCNPASEQYLNDIRQRAIGMLIFEAIKPISGLDEAIKQEKDFLLDFSTRENMEISISGRILSKPGEADYGRLLTFTDVTKYKQIEAVEKEHRELAEAYRDVLVALTSTLDFDGVLDQIITNLQRVMPNTMTNLVLIDSDGVGKVVRSVGYKDHSLEEWVKTIHFRTEDVATFRQMIETGKPILVNDAHTLNTWVNKVDNIRSYIGAPIHIKGHTLGFINQDNLEPNFFSEELALRLQSFADLAAIALENARLFKLTQDLAIMDDLTGLNNRRHFFKLAFNETRRSLRFNYPCSLIIFDVDNFKSINDMYGHPMGDQVLKDVARQILSCVREIDICCRYGGDEFCIFLPETDLHGATNLTDRIIATFHNQPMVSNLFSIKITASFGIAQLDNYSQTIDDLLSHADHALYTRQNKMVETDMKFGMSN